jgi:hypothetical protein
MTWPYPGDSPLARARRLAQAYRAALQEADATGCDTLDVLARRWGETWAAPEPTAYDLDDWLTPAQAADLAYVRADTLRQWRRRGRLTGRHTSGGWLYRARDVIELAAQTRRRTPRQLRSQPTGPVRP